MELLKEEWCRDTDNKWFWTYKLPKYLGLHFLTYIEVIVYPYVWQYGGIKLLVV